MTGRQLVGEIFMIIRCILIMTVVGMSGVSVIRAAVELVSDL